VELIITISYPVNNNEPAMDYLFTPDDCG